MEEKYLTVSQLNRYIKFRIDQDANLNHVFLKGEISNFKAHTRGHFYFTLKDENSRINAVMFQGNTKNLGFTPMDGMKVLVTGRISVYESSGGYQVYVDSMMEDGVGNLYIEFEKLKKKLESEGLFDSSHKKKIPKIPKRIGVVTASTGAAIKDILTTIQRRWPIVEVFLFPALVQGRNAAPDIVRQIEKARDFSLDTLIVGRGGGSIEDLWCFNDEMVARAIYDCPIPVISAVGHEIDFTIADFVADLRAPTPTAAAELAVPNQTDFYSHLDQVLHRSRKSVASVLKMAVSRLKHVQENYILQNPVNIYMVKEEKLDRVLEQLQSVYQKKLQQIKTRLLQVQNAYILKNPEVLYKNKRENLKQVKTQIQQGIFRIKERRQYQYENILGKLEVLNPMITIQRGYSITRCNNQIVDSVQKIQKNSILEIEFRDGIIQSKVM